MIMLVALWLVACGDPITHPHMCQKYLVLTRLSDTPTSMNVCQNMAASYRKNGAIQQAMGAPVSYQCRRLAYPDLTNGE